MTDLNEEIKKVHPLLSLLTDKSNESICIIRALSVVIVFAALGFEGYTVWKSGTFDILNYTTGFSALLAAVGGGAWLRSKED